MKNTLFKSDIIYAFAIFFLISSCGDCSSSSRRQRAREIQQKDDSRRNKNQTGDSAPTSTRREIPSPSTNSGKDKSITEVVAQAEKCVFIVYAVDGSRTIGQGTGFFISEEGIGVSNHHVFAPSTEWVIENVNKEQFQVTEVIKQSEDFDFVVFRVESKGKKVPFLPLSAITPQKGENILVLGNPQGLESTLTRGIVSAIRNQENADDLIQIDAAISPGSSGSPVINMKGEVVGIATKKVVGCENCNFAYNIKRIQ